MADAKAEKKNRSHGRIIESAGVILREKGISGASIAEMMDGAGMTVGGFYAHFPSKQSLVAEALRESLRKSRAVLVAGAGDRKGLEWIKAVAKVYLSRQHRDRPQSGCPLPATLGELAREGREVREALADEMGHTVKEFTCHLKAAGLDNPEEEASAIMATMVGGLVLARALRGTPLSDGILNACCRHIERSLPANH
jgi:TetR/AcrR family transcriptional repressor of nem operon